MKSKYDSRFNSQHNWKDLYEHLMSMRVFTLMFHVLGEVSYLEENKLPFKTHLPHVHM